MVYREGNQILKILLIFVIAVLLLSSIVYLLLVAQAPTNNAFQDYLSIPSKDKGELNQEIDEYLLDVLDSEELN